MISHSIRALFAHLLIVGTLAGAGFTTAGCQGRHDNAVGDPATELPPQAQRAPPATSDTPELASGDQLAPLICAQSQQCPSALGELMSFTGSQLGFCTATLVAPDVVLTASHCVPWKAVGADNRIRGNCWLRFPQINSRAKGEARPAESVACDEILEATELHPSNGRHLQADYAYIRLARALERDPISIQARGETSAKTHLSLVFGTRLENRFHTIELLSCARDDAFDLGELSSPKGQSLVMPSCAVRPGFSGGPILDPLTREIVAVVSGVVGYDAAHPDVPKPSIGTRVVRPELAERRPRARVQMK